MAPMRRKSQGSIRSPHVKRNIQSQVTYEGWLCKLEGGALKQWKQRWCVLADFCLFFYKAPREEKVVSSILLPSYKINPCSTDDKISKKFAFKAEHQNMKTYYFAAEDKESMKKWMNAMSLATIMQNSAIFDDDAGFSSYRSRRNRSSSVPSNSSLKQQRSSSCGDRVGEVYLGSDDKYPASSQLYKSPQKQPLYANAPPKPRRLTQTAVYPAELDTAHYGMDQYGNEENTMQYLPMDTEASNPAYVHYSSSYPENDMPVPTACENVPDVYQVKPPRPRSADFLEREHECAIPQYTSQYCSNRQPQRPKSSLEYYNNAAECEDYGFDDYREAVRVQADNFYANKNLMKTRNFHERSRQPDSVTKSDPRLNTHSNSPSCYVPNEAVPSSFTQSHSKERLHKSHYQSDVQQFESPSKSKPGHKESMRRLMEWKQRMLQSPLSRRNQLHSTSSDSSSRQMDYPHHTLRNRDTYQQNYSTSSLEKNVSYQNPNVSYGSYKTHGSASNLHKYGESPYHDSNEQDTLLYHNKNLHEKQPDVLKDTDPNMLSDAADNLYQKNILYCVDSENNEILFSYENSPTEEPAAPTTFHGSHYPPQMHSFSTMPNVNDIGVEPVQANQYSENRHYSNEMLMQDSSSGDVDKAVTYTSDDEASAESDNKHKPMCGNFISDGLRSSDSGLDITSKEATHLKKLVQQSHGLMNKGKRLSVSAGDLLGKTHEELVLLLIQLRRNQSKILKAKEKLENRLKRERVGMPQIKNQQASEQYEELSSQIIHLEKQYKVMQPLVTLVDNMIKLGSLYGSSNRRSFSLPTLDSAQDEVPPAPDSNISLEQTSILSKLLNEDHDLQKHIREINKLEKSLQKETNSISTLHQDKEMLEHTLFGMRNKILDHQDRPVELQKLRKQQRMIEKELVRVKRLLNTSAKKIEDATSKNDQMEKEILHLRQLLQQALKTGSTEMKSSQHNRADLEAELTRLQSVLDELANHRHEINNSVEKLKNEAGRSKGSEVRASPTGVAGSAPLPLRKKHHNMYLETDLDTMVTRDLAVPNEKDFDDIPVYANAEEISIPTDEAVIGDASSYHTDMMPPTTQFDHVDNELCAMQDINDADERMKRFYGILPKEKPCEIKTVRIVKRQSERRSRERDKKKVSYDDDPSSIWVVEEPDLSSDDYLEMEESSNAAPIPRPTSINLSNTTSGQQASSQSAHERLFGSNSASKHKAHLKAHPIKKSKRRHYTVSGYQYIMDPQFSQYFTERPRSRDDVDMERCLRTANTPDIVRSTIKKNDIFDDSLIDRELGLPQKIEIPERYVEIEPEHLSATEKLRRSLKAENICKMLSETTTSYEDVEKKNNCPETLHKKLSEEKRKRAQLLSLNQALAREVVERSKAVAVFATLERMMKKPLTPVDEDLSPMTPLPITQQRYNFLT